MPTFWCKARTGSAVWHAMNCCNGSSTKTSEVEETLYHSYKGTVADN